MFVDLLQLYAIPWFLTMYARQYFCRCLLFLVCKLFLVAIDML